MKFFIDTADIKEIREAAAMGHPMHVHEAAMLGPHVATGPLSILLQLAKPPLTAPGSQQISRGLGEGPEVIGALLRIATR